MRQTATAVRQIVVGIVELPLDSDRKNPSILTKRSFGIAVLSHPLPARSLLRPSDRVVTKTSPRAESVRSLIRTVSILPLSRPSLSLACHRPLPVISPLAVILSEAKNPRICSCTCRCLSSVFAVAVLLHLRLSVLRIRHCLFSCCHSAAKRRNLTASP